MMCEDTAVAPTQNVESFSFSWCRDTWEDPMTGTQVVRLSPDEDMDFVTAYFRIDTFTSDGETLVFCGGPADGEKNPGGSPASESTLWSLNLRSGEYRRYHTFRPGNMGIPHACTQHDPDLVHLVVKENDGHEEIQRVRLSSGEVEQIRPDRDFHEIYDPGCSADGRFVFIPESELYPKGKWEIENSHMSNAERRKMRLSNPGEQIYYRMNLETGHCEEIFRECAIIGHPNPNPVYPNFFAYCWNDPVVGEEFERIHFVDLDSNERWRSNFPLSDNHMGHEMWSRDGRSMWGHGGYHGYQFIGQYMLADRSWNIWVVPIGSGDSMHVQIAPDESFLVGDGKNWGWNTEHEARGSAASGDVLHSFDGVGAHSLGEVIWRFDLPATSFLTPENHLKYATRDSLANPIYRHPEQFVSVRPICRFRSRQRLLNRPFRLESNAHVLPDSRWVMFTSCSEDGRSEIWAAKA